MMRAKNTMTMKKIVKRANMSLRLTNKKDQMKLIQMHNLIKILASQHQTRKKVTLKKIPRMKKIVVIMTITIIVKILPLNRKMLK